MLVSCSFFGGSLCAQEQERKLEERVLKPDLTKAFNLERSPLGGKRAYQAGGQSGGNTVREFYAPQRYGPKAYEAKEFGGAKGWWFGKSWFGGKREASLGKSAPPFANKKADTKTLSVADARETS